MNHLSVQLSTATGCVFSGSATSLDVRTESGSIHVNSNEKSYLNMLHATEVTVQTPDGPQVFALDNAVAGAEGTLLHRARGKRPPHRGRDYRRVR